MAHPACSAAPWYRCRTAGIYGEPDDALELTGKAESYSPKRARGKNQPHVLVGLLQRAVSESLSAMRM
jgi:hypothetical protein